MGIIKKILVLMVLFTILTVFTGVVSAASLNVTDTELAATGVKNYTAAHGHVPGYVDVSDKNSTAASFLNTITSYTVELNSGSTTPVTIASVSAAPSPSGSATGTLQKSAYVTVANNVKSYINTNHRAPNYASSSLGNIRYESLIYMYSRILDYYRTNNQLPSSITVTSITGVDSTGVTIDNMPPDVTNNLASGTYNTTKSVTLTATDDFDTNPTIYYSTNNGTSWNNQVKTLTLNLNQGVTNLKYYGRDASGNIGTTQTATYTIDFTAPTITANPVGGIYNTTQTVTLTATDNFDPKPTIYYTLNGTTPTTSSTKYTGPINIINPGTTILEFIGLDFAGNQAPIQTLDYTLDLVSNINTGKNYLHIQDAIDDPLTLNGQVIKIHSGTYIENIVINKTLTLMPFSGENVDIGALNSSNPTLTVNSLGNGTVIQGFTITGATDSNGIYLDGTSNCNITENILTNNVNGIVLSNSLNNTLMGNNATGNGNNGIYLGGSNSNLIQDNIVSNSTHYDGIYLTSSNSNIVSGNTAIGNGDSGIVSFSSGYNVIFGNTAKSNTNYGIYISGANNDTIQNNIVINNINYSGIGLTSSNNNTLIGNNATGNGNNGIYIYNSTYNIMQNDMVASNNYGIYISSSNNTTIQSNNVTNNFVNGIELDNSLNGVIWGNVITNNQNIGINLYNSSAQVNFNRITGNIAHGLENEGNGTVNATNNWWGTNTLNISLNTSSDIKIGSGTVTYDPWLVLSVNVNPTSTNSNSTVSADLNHDDHGNDASPLGNIPDGIPVNFTTNLGTITSPGYTKNGKTSTTFNRDTSTSGTATITGTLDKQTVQTNITIDTIAPTVTATLANGFYNTTKSVNLSATDNIDLAPTIYYTTDGSNPTISSTKYVGIINILGTTTLKFMAVDAAGNIGATQTRSYIIDTVPPTVTASLPGGVYNTTQIVNLSAMDDLDPNPTIYYTIDGTLPTTSSAKYNCPIIINKPGSTILEFIAVDAAGNQGPIQIQNYTLNLISNINTTKNYSTIQNAIDDPSTSNGDILELQSGTYTENIVINKKITLRPINGENVTIQSANPSNNVITINSNGIGSIIEKLTITGATGANSCGIYLDSVNNCNITDNVLINNGNGVKINNSNYTFISGNTVTNNTGNGIEFDSSDNNTILANTVKNNLSEGIYLDHSDSNLISENNVMNNSGDGIYIGYSNYNLISGNAVTNNSGNGVYLEASAYNKVWNSTITNNSNGIYLDLSYGSELTGNVITNNHNNGIYLVSSNNAKITQNTLKNNSGSGINFDGSSGNFNFNVLSGNGAYGLYGFFEHYDTDSVNATNNWWGTNSPIVSSNNGSDIYIVAGNFTYNPWLSADMGFALNFTQDDIDNAANTVKTYIETHHALPSSITISGEQVTIPQFLKLATTSLLNIKGNYAFLLNYGVPSTPSENMTSGIINATEFMNIASSVNSFMDSNGKAPNYVTSSEGNIRYESLVYIYSEILSSYNINGDLPYDITVDPWSVISNTNTLFYSIDQVNNASSTVKAYVESHHALPSSVTISGTQVSMASFLELEAVTIQNIEYNFDASSVFQSYGAASSPSETITSRNMGETEYINVAIAVRTFMNDPSYKKAPNYAITSFGNMRYESLVYTYSQLLDYYNSTGYLPENVTVNPWSVVSNSGTVFFTVDQINSAAKTVKNYIESNHALPNNVTICGSQLSMPQFLQLSTEELLNFEGKLCTSFVPRTYVTAPSPSENATNGNLNSTEYLNIANNVNSFMDSNGKAPNYITSSLGNIRYESLVYMFSQILNSYNNTNGTLPDYITINTWSIISNASTVFLDMNQINTASETVKSYVETNYNLPGTVTISGVQVNMPQYLELATTTLLNIEGNLNTSIVLGNIDKCYMSTENIVSGDIKK